MSSIQATTTYRPSLGPVVRWRHKRLETVSCASFSSTVYQKLRNLSHAKLAYSAPKYKRLAPVYGISDAGNAASNDDPFSMESLKKAMEGLKQEKPLQDALKEKMRELDFGGDGGAGKKPPRGGGGGGGGANEGSGPEFKNFREWLDEALQVFLATIGLISVYVYIVRGEELVLLARDYIKYLIWGKKSVRLADSIERWSNFWSEMTFTRNINMQMFLDMALACKGSLWYSPNDVPDVVPSFREARSKVGGNGEEEGEEEGEDWEEREEEREEDEEGDEMERLEDQIRQRSPWEESDNDEKSDDEESNE